MYLKACRSLDLEGCETDISKCETRIEHEEELRRSRFETAWRQNVSELYRRSLQWTSGRREDADDALGQAALIALEKMPQELQPVEARRWLLRLVYSKCMDISRYRRRSPCLVRDNDDSPKEEVEAAGPGHESVLLAGELISVTRDRIQSLPPRLRKVAELHLLGEVPYSEIADRLALTEVNVRKRMQEARAFLREHLQAYMEGDVRIQAPRTANQSSPAINEPEPLRLSGWTLESLERYVQRHPRGWKKRWELALRLREAGFPEKAVFHFREAASRQPHRMELWSDLGTILLLLGCSTEAREAFEAALRRARDEVSRARLRDLIARC
ncbi:MAG TPA: RNA polymerase sigma factor [Thermoanaerobaculia bacterium]|nr:RNA polymerase sigma factor [Thermoanaerobaculia bacterium]